MEDALNPGAAFAMVAIFIEKSVVVFGSKFVTPTIREMRDNNPYFKGALANLGEGYTLAEVAVDGFEAHNKQQKAKFNRGLQAGGRGDPVGPISDLLVRGVLRPWCMCKYVVGREDEGKGET